MSLWKAFACFGDSFYLILKLILKLSCVWILEFNFFPSFSLISLIIYFSVIIIRSVHVASINLDSWYFIFYLVFLKFSLSQPLCYLSIYLHNFKVYIKSAFLFSECSPFKDATTNGVFLCQKYFWIYECVENLNGAMHRLFWHRLF